MGRRHSKKLAPVIAQIEAAFVNMGCSQRRKTDIVDVEEKIGPIEICIFNVGGNVFFPILETEFRKVWEMCAYAAFLSGRTQNHGRTAKRFYLCTNRFGARQLGICCLCLRKIWPSPVNGSLGQRTSTWHTLLMRANTEFVRDRLRKAGTNPDHCHQTP